MGGSAFVFAKSETVFHQSSYSLPCFCSGIMIEVEKNTGYSLGTLNFDEQKRVSGSPCENYSIASSDESTWLDRLRLNNCLHDVNSVR